jgi:hypothetical protein
MKRLFLSAIMATTLISTSFANETKINSRVSSNFKNQFAEANNVEWTSKQDFFKANFTEDGKSREAFYNNNGELISTSTQINIDDLPASTKRAFAKKYDGYVVKEAIKMDSNDESAYYISVENDKQSLILKVLDGTILIFKKKALN